MHAVVAVQVNPLDRHARAFDCRILHDGWRTHESHYGAMMIRVSGPVEDVGARSFHRVHDREDDRGIATFAEIRHGLEQWGRAHDIRR